MELQYANLPNAGVTWGGDQNAMDGGVDVRVKLTTPIHPDGFIPRANTCIQVKATDMPRSEILKEMKPNGKLRPVIKEIADDKGAYIIVSSQGSTSDFALSNRKEAMKEAVVDYPNNSKLKLDFYDRNRIATWVRAYAKLKVYQKS